RQVSHRLPSALPGVVLGGFLQVRQCLLVLTDLFGEHGVSVPLFDVRNNRGFGAHWLVHGKHEPSHVVALCHPMSPSFSSSSSYRSGRSMPFQASAVATPRIAPPANDCSNPIAVPVAPSRAFCVATERATFRTSAAPANKTIRNLLIGFPC